MKSSLVSVAVIVLLLAASIGFVFVSNSALFRNSEKVTGSSLDASIAQAETNVSTHASTTKPYIALASLYLQKIRETSDSSYYQRIESLMDSAEKVDSKDGDIFAIRSSISMGRHDFKSGYIAIQKALRLNPNRPAYYGLRGDSEIELGKYDAAVTSFQTMVDKRPDFNSWSRIAYIRELNGDVIGAKSSLNQSIGSGSTYPENIAWAYVELGKLDLRDNPDAATHDFLHQ